MITLLLLNKYIVFAFIFTSLNVACGLIGIIISLYYSSEYFFLPLQLLIFGAIFDFLDGKIAKMSPTESSIGIYSDSIGDTITFAILPGIMVLNAPVIGNEFPKIAALLSLGIVGFYSLCGWARLVRFTFRPTAVYYEGFPSPAAALFVGSSAMLAQFIELEWFFWPNGVPLTCITIIVGLLMVLTIKYPNPKRQMKSDLILIGVAGIVVLFYVFVPHIITLMGILIIAILYVIFGPYYLKKTEEIKN